MAKCVCRRLDCETHWNSMSAAGIHSVSVKISAVFSDVKWYGLLYVHMHDLCFSQHLIQSTGPLLQSDIISHYHYHPSAPEPIYLERHEAKMIYILFNPPPLCLWSSLSSNPSYSTVQLTALPSDLKRAFCAVGPNEMQPVSSSISNQSVINR